MAIQRFAEQELFKCIMARNRAKKKSFAHSCAEELPQFDPILLSRRASGKPTSFMARETGS